MCEFADVWVFDIWILFLILDIFRDRVHVNGLRLLLERILDTFSPRMPVLQVHDRLIEPDIQQRWFASLSDETNDGPLLAFNHLPDIGFQQIPTHAPLSLARIHLLLFEIEAVRTIHVAERSGRFCDNLKVGRAAVVTEFHTGMYEIITTAGRVRR